MVHLWLYDEGHWSVESGFMWCFPCQGNSTVRNTQIFKRELALAEEKLVRIFMNPEFHLYTAVPVAITYVTYLFSTMEKTAGMLAFVQTLLSTGKSVPADVSGDIRGLVASSMTVWTAIQCSCKTIRKRLRSIGERALYVGRAVATDDLTNSINVR